MSLHAVLRQACSDSPSLGDGFRCLSSAMPDVGRGMGLMPEALYEVVSGQLDMALRASRSHSQEVRSLALTHILQVLQSRQRLLSLDLKFPLRKDFTPTSKRPWRTPIRACHVLQGIYGTGMHGYSRSEPPSCLPPVLKRKLVAEVCRRGGVAAAGTALVRSPPPGWF